jgi:hypothetical protein
MFFGEWVERENAQPLETQSEIKPIKENGR